MSVTVKFPITLEKRMKLGRKQIIFPASWEEFLDLSAIAEYQVEFENNEITAMSIASDPHEAIVSNLIFLFKLLFDHNPDIHARGNNRPVHIEEQRVYNPDLHVTKSTPEIIKYRKGLSANKNPWIIVEVLSNSTKKKIGKKN